ncbi:hypothetical protein FRB95_004134 [Tulasnella sp. JGI-2019a]|nr:hypothetical protein FRB95_004134 [Tulasnella sp. JGI-2019a]
MPPILPPEMWISIIKEISQPCSASAYRLDANCRIALSQLCLVSRAFNKLTEPLLYQRVFITPENLRSFAEAVVMLVGESVNPQGYTPTDRGKRVRSLALAQFNKPTLSHLQHIGIVRYAIRDFVTRTYFDVSIYRFDLNPPLHAHALSTVQNALSGLQHIEEFCSTMPQLTLELAPTWRRLKRLAVSQATLSIDILEGLAELETLEICMTTSARSMESSLFDNPNILTHGDWADQGMELVLIVLRSHDLVCRALREVLNPLELEKKIEGRKGALKLMEASEALVRRTQQGYYRDDIALWFPREVLDGSIWERDREEWRSYLKREDSGL